MRILVTGVSGQVGSALLRSLRPLGELLPANRAVLDLASPADLGARLDQLRPELIVNPAAYTAVDRAEDERDLAFAVNGESPGLIARWAADHGIPLVHFSTDYVFDGSGTRPWREDDVAAPLNVYGESKFAGEQAVAKAGGAHLIVRTSWVYAAQGSNFLRTIARLAAEREQLSIVADQIGAPTSAAWIASVLEKILVANLSGLPAVFDSAGHKLHVAAGGRTSWHGFATAIVEGLNRRGPPVKTKSLIPIEAKDYPTKAQRPYNSRMDMSRLTDIFGVTPEAWETLLDRELDQLASK